MLFLPLSPPASVPDTVIVERTSHYDIAGTDVRGLIREMDQKGPSIGLGTYWANTQVGVSAWWDTKQLPSHCVLVNPGVRVNVNIVYPSWKPEAGAEPALLAKWSKMLKSLVRHEGKHAQYAREEGNAMTSELRAHSSARTCSELDRYLTTRSTELRAIHQKADEDIDTRTGHGVNEGVNLQ